MTFELEAAKRVTGLENRISRLETLEGGGAVTTGFWTLLEEHILTDDTQTVITFDNINQSYQALVFIISARWFDGSGKSPLRMRWNDWIQVPLRFVGAYFWRYWESAGDNVTFLSNYIEIGNLGVNDMFTGMTLFIPDYYRDDKSVMCVWRAGGWNSVASQWVDGLGTGCFDIGYSEEFSQRNDPLTKITFSAYGGASTLFGENSKFSLYGIGIAT